MTGAAPDDDPRDVAGIDDGTTYAEAVVELEQILRELEDDRIDVDVLAARVRRAALLLRFCRGRIAGAKLEIEQVVADLDAFDDLVAEDDPNPDDAAVDHPPEPRS